MPNFGRIDTLLASDQHVEEFLEVNALHHAGLLPDDESGAAPGSRVGPYIIEGRLEPAVWGRCSSRTMSVWAARWRSNCSTPVDRRRSSRGRFLREARLALSTTRTSAPCTRSGRRGRPSSRCSMSKVRPCSNHRPRAAPCRGSCSPSAGKSPTRSRRPTPAASSIATSRAATLS